MTVLLKIILSGRSVFSHQIKYSLREDTVTLNEGSHDTKDLNNLSIQKTGHFSKLCGEATKSNLGDKEVPKHNLCISTSLVPIGKTKRPTKTPCKNPLTEQCRCNVGFNVYDNSESRQELHGNCMNIHTLNAYSEGDLALGCACFVEGSPCTQRSNKPMLSF